MPTSKSAKKRMRAAGKARAANQSDRAELRTAKRRFREAAAGDEKDKAKAALKRLFSVADKSAKKGIIKQNTADRYKSRATKVLAKG